jgi:hypothetical protein
MVKMTLMTKQFWLFRNIYPDCKPIGTVFESNIHLNTTWELTYQRVVKVESLWKWTIYSFIDQDMTSEVTHQSSTHSRALAISLAIWSSDMSTVLAWFIWHSIEAETQTIIVANCYKDLHIRNFLHLDLWLKVFILSEQNFFGLVPEPAGQVPVITVRVN